MFNSILVDGRQQETALRPSVQTGSGSHYPQSRYTCVLTNGNESNESESCHFFLSTDSCLFGCHSCKLAHGQVNMGTQRLKLRVWGQSLCARVRKCVRLRGPVLVRHGP